MVTKSENMIEIKPELLKKISRIAKDENITENKLINEIMEIGMKNRTKSRIPEHLIANKDTYNPDPKRRMEMAGIIKTKEPFDTVKALEDIRTRNY